MATRDFTDPGLALSIKAMMVTIAVLIGVATSLAYLAGIGQLNDVYGFVGAVLILQAVFYAIL